MAERVFDCEANETKLLSNFVRKQTKYGATAKHTTCTKEKLIAHPVESTDTLAGLALRYGVSIEKIKRVNNLWTSDSLYLRPVLHIPVPSDLVVETQETSGGHNKHFGCSNVIVANRKENASSESNRIEDSECPKVNCFKHNFKLGQQTKVLASSKLENGVDGSEWNERDDESVADFLIRIDSHIAKSKDHINTIVQQKSKLTNTYSDDDLFKLRGKHSNCYNTRNNSVSSTSLNEYMSDVPKVMTQSRKVKSSLKRLEKKQDELFEL
ncbi:LysM and hypothetical peptidoglycan-binding domain-containing protein 2-like protein [Dinothrombium tinctorium]|uniref:LysM and hypothetical peptidoglycan-binding domain-containing protein 2-like protein n=1 Tax=Dinothrombium tinctorium TaxID=1965070 RepID=A0A3S3PLN5_9ACAR|nr:LysM and hypothetical peptidoglycan-binding domain-containing protein 2-like protein [Dinothrombium tinctorium]RWS12636.1 LysM and hypothetical peptidoglycan-binding domain-containing protein 2-like protein [Dinothrombium tinctorium]